MSRSENLPTLPQAASNVMRLADDPDVNTRDIEKAIEMDPALTGKILKIANSSYYGSLQVRTLGKAISFLGLTTVRSAVVSIAMQQMVSGRVLCPSLNRIEFWKHCLAVAIASRIIGKLKMPGSAEELYCAGMMHEVGLLAMEKFVPEELHASIKQAQVTGGDFVDIQRQQMGFSHIEVGVILAKKWSLNSVVMDAIQFWNQPERSVECQASTMVVAVSKSMANAIGFKHSGLWGDDEVNLLYAQEVGLPQEQFGIIGEVIAQEIARAQESFQIAA